MNEDYVKQIISWKYDHPFSIYNLENNKDTVNELLSGYYYVFIDNKNNVVGFYCYGPSAQVHGFNYFDIYDDFNYVDLGFGLNPDHCHRGLGCSFVNIGLEFMKITLKTNKFRLTVHNFNKPAIKVYKNVGFNIENFFINNKLAYLIMIKNEKRYEN